MPARQNTKKRSKKPSRRLQLSPEAGAVGEVRTIPTRWLNAVIGLFLLVPAGLLTQTFFTAFSRATLEHAFWATEEFWFFGLGAVLWTLWFFGSIWALGEPRPLRAYIFGHELTHAIWVWLMGGRVSHFEVRRDGGHILTDTHNFWIALAPYFYPIYSIAVIAFYGAVSLFYDLASADIEFLWITPLQWLFLALGASWAFHMSFTCWMIPKGQSDLTYHGTFFSLVVIYTVNLALLAVFLIVAAPEVSWFSFGRELLENTEDFSSLIWLSLQQNFRPR
ncbi:hypothetical protein ACXR0O_17470 [Verrucomicrobiota bacterium sgz303538]